MTSYATETIACRTDNPIPKPNDRRKTESAAATNPTLRRYLDRYDDENCYWDCGDGPSFFAATEILGSPQQATWGVCRRLVRGRLDVGDFVAFFCARQVERYRWEYFYNGFGTVGELLTREQIWTDSHCEPYRRFFNILARSVDGALQQRETIHEFHNKDWLQRAVAPFIVFDPDRSRFDMSHPTHVASYAGRGGGIEEWNDDDVVRTIAKLILPETSSTRRLRTTHEQMSHPELPLRDQAKRAGGFESLRCERGGPLAHSLPAPCRSVALDVVGLPRRTGRSGRKGGMAIGRDFSACKCRLRRPAPARAQVTDLRRRYHALVAGMAELALSDIERLSLTRRTFGRAGRADVAVDLHS